MSYAVVTGASSGIGKEFAYQLDKKGYSLVLVARSEELLQKIKNDLNSECIILTHDLSKANECLELLDEIRELNVEIFINNAGFGDFKSYIEMDDKKLNDMIDVNVRAVSILTKGVLEIFEKKDKGYLLNVASSAGLFPAGPYMATYYATKAYVRSLTLGVARELKEAKSNVYLGALCPGPVNTNFNRVADVEFSLKGISAQKCVKYALKKMKQRKVIIVPTLIMKLGIFGTRFAGTNFVVALTGKQQRKKGKN